MQATEGREVVSL